jgi:hypothetical protein
VIGLVGATGWEGIEILLDYLFPAASIDHALPDTVFDVVLGVFWGRGRGLCGRPPLRPPLQPLS